MSKLTINHLIELKKKDHTERVNLLSQIEVAFNCGVTASQIFDKIYDVFRNHRDSYVSLIADECKLKSEKLMREMKAGISGLFDEDDDEDYFDENFIDFDAIWLYKYLSIENSHDEITYDKFVKIHNVIIIDFIDKCVESIQKLVSVEKYKDSALRKFAASFEHAKSALNTANDLMVNSVLTVANDLQEDEWRRSCKQAIELFDSKRETIIIGMNSKYDKRINVEEVLTIVRQKLVELMECKRDFARIDSILRSPEIKDSLYKSIFNEKSEDGLKIILDINNECVISSFLSIIHMSAVYKS